MVFVRENDHELVVMRLLHIYGEGESQERLWPSLKKAQLAGEDFPMTHGEQTRDFTPVEFAEKQWKKFGATGRLKLGEIPYRNNEVMRYEPLV